MSSSSPSRRSFLRTAAALGAGAPFLGSLLAARRAEAAAAGKPFRFVLIRDVLGFGHTGQMAGGPAPHRLVPPQARDAKGAPLSASALPIGPGGTREVVFRSAEDLPPSLHPLRRFWANTLILDRFFNPHGVGLHGNGRSMYTCAATGALLDGKRPPSIQSLVGAKLSEGLPFDVVSMSHKGDAPYRYYDRYLAPVGSGAAGLLQQRKGVLGVVRAQAARMQGSLGKKDAEWMDRYLGSLREAERSLERLATWKCERQAPPGTDDNASEYEPVKPLISHVNLDIAATALTCGLTRAVSLEFVPGRGPFQFFDPAPNTYNLMGALGEQAISSDTRYTDLVTGLRVETAAAGDNGGDAWRQDRHDNHHLGYVGILTAIDRWEAALVARLIEKLQATPEGPGTMWDHTLILWVNSGGGIHHYGASDHPAILLGGNGVMGGKPGQLRGGRYLSFPKKTRSMADLFVTAANAVGLEVAKFGDPAICQGALPGVRV